MREEWKHACSMTASSGTEGAGIGGRGSRRQDRGNGRKIRVDSNALKHAGRAAPRRAGVDAYQSSGRRTQRILRSQHRKAARAATKGAASAGARAGARAGAAIGAKGAARRGCGYRLLAELVVWERRKCFLFS